MVWVQKSVTHTHTHGHPDTHTQTTQEMEFVLPVLELQHVMAVACEGFPSLDFQWKDDRVDGRSHTMCHEPLFFTVTPSTAPNLLNLTTRWSLVKDLHGETSPVSPAARSNSAVFIQSKQQSNRDGSPALQLTDSRQQRRVSEHVNRDWSADTKRRECLH